MKYFIYITLALVLFTSCKTESEEDPVTTLEVRIQDQDGSSITGAVQVYLFTSLSDFTTSVVNEVATNYVAEVTSSGGTATFSNLDPTVTYYVYVYYYEDFALNNYFSQFEIRNLLQADKTTVAVIRLEPYKIANIGFYSQASLNLVGDPIEIYFGLDRIHVGTLEGPILSTSPASIDDAGVVKVLYQNEGTHNWEATGANGCHWQGQVTVTTNASDATFTSIELEACQNGVYALWSGTTNLDNAGDKIVVILGNADTVGYITSPRSSVPNSCSDDGLLLISRPAGTYTYQAYSENGLCSWQEDFTIVADDCSTVDNEELSGCN